MRPDRFKIFISLLLAGMTLVVYWPACDNGFVHFDDGLYVFRNPHVQAGLTGASIRWAWTGTCAANWHPLTMLSLELDAQLQGLEARGFHRTNVLLHAANVALLFWVLCRMTGAIGRSALVAALFGMHPLHVESVAWIAERKDVLSTLFWLLTMLAYLRYVDQPHWRRYALLILAFTLGLLAKPMLVTLPWVLLLLDYWPLNRRGKGEGERGKAEAVGSSSLPPPPSPLPPFWEKVPLFVLALCSCAITWFVQGRDGSISSFEVLPFGLRVQNALVAYVVYLGMTFWPVGLAIYYPHLRTRLQAGPALAAGLALAVLSALAVALRRRWPYFFVGWFWYLGTLVPVIGLVQVGSQAMADRYTYVPHIGLFILVVWGLADLAARWHLSELAAGVAAILIVTCAGLTWVQIHTWHDDFSLWNHAVEVTEHNALAHTNLGIQWRNRGERQEAIHQFQLALHIDPQNPKAHYNLGKALAEQGQNEEAIHHYAEALRVNPKYAQAHYNLGLLLVRLRKFHQAMEHFREVAAIDPDDVEAYYNLGLCLAEVGQRNEALASFTKALDLARASGKKQMVDEIQARLRAYRLENPR